MTDRRQVVVTDHPGFSGADPEYAGMYLHARYFDPKLGTFLSPDPIGVAGGMNEYGYASGDPVNRKDPSGLTDCQKSRTSTNGGPWGSWTYYGNCSASDISPAPYLRTNAYGMWPMLPFLHNLPNYQGPGTHLRPGEGNKPQGTAQAAPPVGGDEQGSASNGNGDGGASGRHAPTAMETVGAFYKAYYDALWLAETVSPILDLPLGPDWASGSLQLAYWQTAFEWSSSTGLYFSPLGGSVPRSPIAFNANLNWALQTTPPTPQQKRNYIEGIGYGVTAYNGIGAGVMRVPGTGTYVQIGIGSPGLSFGASYTIPTGTPAQPSMSMAWRWMWFIQTGH